MDQQMAKRLDQRTIPNKSLEAISNVEPVNAPSLMPKNDLEVTFSVSEV
jgi:hypothetical protein